MSDGYVTLFKGNKKLFLALQLNNYPDYSNIVTFVGKSG